jgi:hypothetical protein
MHHPQLYLTSPFCCASSDLHPQAAGRATASAGAETFPDALRTWALARGMKDVDDVVARVM